MGDLTPRYSFYLPGGGSSGLITPDETADIDKINDNFVIVDENIGIRFVTSGTRPLSPKDGSGIYETDTGNLLFWDDTLTQWSAARASRGPVTIYTVTTLAAMSAITDCLVGDYCVVSTPGTGISGAIRYRAVSGTGASTVWESDSRVVADTKVNLDAFIAVSAGIADVGFVLGSVARVLADTGFDYEFITTAGAYRALGMAALTTVIVAGAGTISSSSFAAIPSVPTTVAVTAEAGGRLARISYAFLATCNGGTLEAGVAVTGATTLTPDTAWDGTANVTSNSQICRVFNSTYNGFYMSKIVKLSAGVNNISAQARIGGGGGTKVVYNQQITVELL